MNFRDLTAYEVLEEREIKDVNALGIRLRHKKTGARVVVLSNDDDNKVFQIAFRTTPEDETGVPHIIEHTTLCGSEKFPVKDPFIELAKGSLNTYLNAMTYADKTVYPIASYNDHDFKNLMDVYLDAVFHPNIDKYEEIFKQEGWHYEITDKDEPITINGVVYNEMKGAYSSPDEVLNNQIFKSLFPDNTYGKNSGGNPAHIPELTYADYLAFYNKYYHPSNSYIYLYGDMDVAERLKYMDEEYLSKFDEEYLKQIPDTSIVPQVSDGTCKEVVATYSIAKDEPEENQTYLSYNRVVGDALDRELYLAFDVLDYALVSAPGAPVRQALIDAGIGEDVYGSYDTGIRQSVFSIIAKNANVADKESFLSIIQSTLEQLVKEGLKKEALLAGINSNEFRFREADYGQFPKGLLYGLQVMDSWLFDDDLPFIHLECLDTFELLRSKIGTGYYEKLIQEYLLDNTHGSTVIVAPEREKNTKEEEALAKRLAEYKESLSEEELEKLIADTLALEAYQEEPSSEEDLAKIPLLQREDLRKTVNPLFNEETTLDEVKVLKHKVCTNGIDYVRFLFDAEDVTKAELPYFGLLGALLGYVNTTNYTYADLANETNIYTGGVSVCYNVYPNATSPDSFAVKFEGRAKVLCDNLPIAMKLLQEILLGSDLRDIKRLTEIVAQSKARLQVALSSAGHLVSAMRSLATTSMYGFYQDELRGIAYYRNLCEIEKMLETNPNEVCDKLEALCKKLIARKRLMISFTGDESAYQSAMQTLKETLATIPEGEALGPKLTVTFSDKKEAFSDSSTIQYVAMTGNYRKVGYEYSGGLQVLKTILGLEYLWNNVRIKGGAYGCMCSFLRNGEAYFVSYRDPNLSKTLETYRALPEYLRSFTADEREMTKYIIGTFGNLDTPLTPESKGLRSLAAYLGDMTEEMLQKERDQVLQCTDANIRGFADMIEAVIKQEHICVIGNENMIANEKDLFDEVETIK